MDAAGLQFKVPLVIKRSRGCGFHLTDALVSELRASRWVYLDHLTQGHNGWYVFGESLGAIRRDPALILAVKKGEAEVLALRASGASWKDVAGLELALLDGLSVVEVTIEIEVNEPEAGCESVRVIGGIW
jgi:hypothetical protein